jgi:Glyoxalase/Bleomycin resistance protein/Dioxygenase superfamily
MATVQHVAPIFPTADPVAMQAHYEALGFEVQVHGGGYATATRDGIRIHFRPVPGLDRARPAQEDAQEDAQERPQGYERGAAYLGVDDAEALHAEWKAADVGETSELFDPGFGVLEAAHTDGDGNLLRFGSPLRHD